MQEILVVQRLIVEGHAPQREGGGTQQQREDPGAACEQPRAPEQKQAETSLQSKQNDRDRIHERRPFAKKKRELFTPAEISDIFKIALDKETAEMVKYLAICAGEGALCPTIHLHSVYQREPVKSMPGSAILTTGPGVSRSRRRVCHAKRCSLRQDPAKELCPCR